MSVKELTLQSLDDLDGGKIAVAWQKQLQRLIADCEDRPGELKERELQLTLKIAPVQDVAGLCEEVSSQWFVTSKIPNQKSKVYTLGIRKGQKLAFSDVQPDGRPGLFDGDEGDDE